MDALFARAARLTKVPFSAPERVIGKTTTSALQSGLVYGFAGQVDAIVAPDPRRARAPDAPAIATGGLAELIAPHAQTISRDRPGADRCEGLTRVVWENEPARVTLRPCGRARDAQPTRNAGR